MAEENEIKIVGEQRFRDAPEMRRVTLDMPKLAWLILKKEIKSSSFYNIIEKDEEVTKLLTQNERE